MDQSSIVLLQRGSEFTVANSKMNDDSAGRVGCLENSGCVIIWRRKGKSRKGKKSEE